MKRSIVITEKDITRMVKKVLKELNAGHGRGRRRITETNLIQPYDTRKTNPLQLPEVDFEELDNFDKRHNAGKGKKESSTKALRQVTNAPLKQEIDDYQKDLTDRIQQRFMNQNGTDKPIIPKDKLPKIGNKKLARELAKYGMIVQIAGKTFSYGNSKVPEDTLVVTLTSAFNCPSKENGECGWGKRCYAHGTERQYDNTEARNLRNQEFFGMLSVKELLKLVEMYIEAAPIRLKYIRLHEDGDFKDQAVLEFCDKLAGHLRAKYGVSTTAYTHRILDYSNVKNMIINASSYRIKSADRYFICVPKEDWDKIPEGLDLSGKRIQMNSAEDGSPVDTTHGTFKCYCNCRKCRFCYQSKEENGEPEGNMVSVIEYPH